MPNEVAWQSFVLDYTATGLSLRQRPRALLRPMLLAQGYAETRRHDSVWPGSWIQLLGVVFIRQRPGAAKGIVFMTTADQFSVGNLFVYTDVGVRVLAALISSQLFAAEGKIERETG